MCIKKIKNKTHAYLMFFDIVVSFQESECSSWVVFVAEGPIRFIIGQLRMHAPRSCNKCSDRKNNRPTDGQTGSLGSYSTSNKNKTECAHA